MRDLMPLTASYFGLIFNVKRYNEECYCKICGKTNIGMSYSANRIIEEVKL